MRHDLDTMAEGAVILDGLDDAIVGIVEEFGNEKRILYSKYKIFEILVKRDNMTYADAEEFYNYNILGMYVSPQNPVFLDVELR